MKSARRLNTQSLFFHSFNQKTELQIKYLKPTLFYHFILIVTMLVFTSCKKNQPPSCDITSPLVNTVYLEDEIIDITVDADDSDGTILEVRLYLNETGLTSIQNWPYQFQINSSDYTPGNYVIKATAIDNEGMETDDEVQIIIGALPAVNTNIPSSIEFETAVVGGIVTDPGSEPITETGIYLDKVANPEITGEKIAIESSNGEFSTELTGLEIGTTYYIKAYAVNSHGESIGNEEQFTTFTGVQDIEGNVYKTVQIGEQWWMAENLAVTKYNNGVDIPLIEDNNDWAGLSTPAYCWSWNDKDTYGDTYGILYNGYTVISENNLCPSEWHVPSDEDWIELERFLGISEGVLYALGNRGTNEGGKLKESGFEHWNEPNEGAIDSYNFTALPAGYRYIDGSFLEAGTGTAFWATTIHVDNQLYRRGLFKGSAQISRSAYYVGGAFNVRCVKD